MLTGRGWSALGAGAGATILWVLLGEVELLLVGIFLVAGALAGLALVTLSRTDMTVRRRLHPVVVHAGGRAVVRIELANRSRRSLVNLLLEDRVAGLGTARFAAARVPPGSAFQARYEIACRRRGIHMVGPASVDLSDPFGTARIEEPVGQADRLVVYPAMEDLDGLPSVRGHEPSQRASRPHFAPRGGEDFFTLREYQHGDDLRRVHWRSSAKRDELMIRQLENPWQSRALVFLDLRSTVYAEEEAFEQAVRGAASAVRHLDRSGFSVDLWTGSVPVRPARQAERWAALEALATVETASELDLGATAIRIRRQAGGGAVVVVTGHPDPELLGFFTLMARGFGRSVLMAVTEDPPPASFGRAGAMVVTTGPHASWRPAWTRALRRSWSTASAG